MNKDARIRAIAGYIIYGQRMVGLQNDVANLSVFRIDMLYKPGPARQSPRPPRKFLVKANVKRK